MLYLKALMHKISLKKQIVFLILFTLFVIADQIFSNTDFFEIIKAILPILCIGLSVLYLQISDEPLGSHILILLTLFSTYLYKVVTSLLSLDLSSFRLLTPINGFDAIGAVIAVYLILFVISLLMNEKKISLNVSFHPIMVFLSIFLYLRYGFYMALTSTLIYLFISTFKYKSALYLYLFSFVIISPFNILDLLIDRVGFNIMSYWFFYIFELVLFIWVIVLLIRSLNDEKI